MLRIFFASLAVFAAGCACKPPPNPGEFEIGQGEHAFQRLDPSGFDIVYGNAGQGPASQHIWIAVGCSVCEGSLVVTMSGTDPLGGAIVSEQTSTFTDFRVCTEKEVSWGFAAGLRLRLDDEALSTASDSITVSVSITSEAGQPVASGELTAPY